MKTKTIKKVMFGAIMVSSLLTTACKKEGCTDTFAKNYNPEAKKDNGTCTYTAEKTFWFDYQSYLFLQNKNATTVYLTIDNDHSCSTHYTQFDSLPPTCETTKSNLNVILDLGTTKTKETTLIVYDNLNDTLINHKTTFNNYENLCEPEELTFQ